MSIIFRDPSADKAKQEAYARKVDEATRTGRPWPAPLPMDNSAASFERTIVRSDVPSKNMLTAPTPFMGFKEPQLPEKPAPLDQVFPSRSSFTTGANTQPFTLREKGGK